MADFGEDPFLFTQAREITNFLSDLPSVGLLLDVGHLKVTAETLRLDRAEFMNQCKPYIKGYHLSENNGLADTNQPLTETSWFWPYLDQELDYFTLEVYGVAEQELVKQIDLVRKKICS